MEIASTISAMSTFSAFSLVDSLGKSGLPSWIAFANAWTTFLIAALASFAAVCIACLVTFPRIGTSQDLHWTEVARRVDPLRRSVQLSLALFPVLFGAIGIMNSGPLGFFPSYAMAIVGAAGAVVGVLPLHYWMRSKVGLPVGSIGKQIVGAVATLLFIAPHLVVSAILILCLSSGIIELPIFLATAAFFATFVLIFGLELRLARVVGALRTAPDHIRAAAERAARKLGVPFPRVYLVPTRYANAYAWPHLHTVAVTEAAAEILSIDELEAVMAHEIGHISEPLSRRLARMGMLAMPQFVVVAVFFLMSMGYSLLVSVTAASVLLALFGSHIGRTLAGAEQDADTKAKSITADGLVYAAALEKLHRYNLIPAVTGHRVAGHPDLYDRMMAVGAKPNFERPKPPTRGLGELAVVLSISLAFLGAAMLKVGPLIAQVAPISDSVNTWLSVGMDGGSTAMGLMKTAEGEHKSKSYASSRLLYKFAAKKFPEPAVYLNWALSSAAAGDCVEARQAVQAARAIGGVGANTQTEISAFVDSCVPSTATAH